METLLVCRYLRIHLLGTRLDGKIGLCVGDLFLASVPSHGDEIASVTCQEVVGALALGTTADADLFRDLKKMLFHLFADTTTRCLGLCDNSEEVLPPRITKHRLNFPACPVLWYCPCRTLDTL